MLEVMQIKLGTVVKELSPLYQKIEFGNICQFDN